MAPLDAALALAQMDNFAVLIPQHLKLDVPRMFQEFLGIHVRRPEGLLSFAAGRLIGLQKVFLAAHNAHAPAATSCRSFQNQWVANFARLFSELFFPFDNAFAAWDGREAGRFNLPPRAVLFSHQLDNLRFRADKGDFGGFAHLSKVRILGKETVPRMDGVYVGDFRRADDLGNIQVALAAAGRADADSLICETYMERVSVGFGIHGDSRDTKLFAGANHPEGDFPAIGY